MATYKRNDTDKMLKAVGQGKPSNVFLLVGERYLCNQVAEKLVGLLSPDGLQQVNRIDGEFEDPAKTLASLKTYSMFTGNQVIVVSDTRLFHSKAVAKTIWDRAQKAFARKEKKTALKYLKQLAEIAQKNINELAELPAGTWKTLFSFVKPKDCGWFKEVLVVSGGEASGKERAPENDPTELFMEAFSAGVPANNILILLAETVDKRKKFYKFIVKHGVVADLSVATGSSSAARTDQESVLKALVSKTVGDFAKKIEPQAVLELLERVGFHPVAVVRETEKLALYSGDDMVITLQSVREVVGRTREDALFELTEAYAEQDLHKSILIAHRLFCDGVHPLVLVSGLRNHLRKLLLICSIRSSASPVYVPAMSYAVFQKGYLPELKEAQDEWLGMLPGHPYALFMMFEKAGRFSVSLLAEKMAELLDVEHRLKSSAIPPQIVFERFLYETTKLSS